MTTLWTSCITTARPDRPRSDRSTGLSAAAAGAAGGAHRPALAQYHREGNGRSV